MRTFSTAACVTLALALVAAAVETDAGGTSTGVEPEKKKPHVLMVLLDDFGHASAGWHRNVTFGGLNIPPTDEVQTPQLNQLVREGIELTQGYVYVTSPHVTPRHVTSRDGTSPRLHPILPGKLCVTDITPSGFGIPQMSAV
jgi:hypothetical protein